MPVGEDSLQVPGLGKARKHFFEGNRQDELVAVRKYLHRSDQPSAREAIARTSPEKMIL